MREISFTVRGIPRAQQRHKQWSKGVAHGTYDPSKSDKQDFIVLAHAHAPQTPIKAPLALTARCYMPIPTSWSKKRKQEARDGFVPHAKKPDVDNLLKLVMDALEGVFYVRDAQIFSLRGLKQYSHVPRTEVKLMWQEAS